MSENWRLQVSPKLGDTLVNIRAESTEEMQSLLLWAEQNAPRIVAAVEAIRGVGRVAQVFPGSQVVASETVPQQAQRAATVAESTAPQQPQYAPSPTGPPAPSCAHGPRLYKEGKKKDGGQYRAWFCSSTDRNAQCPAQWL